MSGKRYTSGEIATAAGVTVRTIQHYDNIGLLPSTGRTDGGRRYYTQDDLVRLEQIVFYKSLDFPLDQIKERLLLEPGKTELLTMLEEQRLLLLQRMEHLHTSFATIGIMSEMIESDRQPPFALLLRFLSALPGDDVFSRAPQLLTEEQREALSPRFQDVEPVQAFYHRWKEALIEAAVLVHENAPPDSAAAVVERDPLTHRRGHGPHRAIVPAGPQGPDGNGGRRADGFGQPLRGGGFRPVLRQRRPAPRAGREQCGRR